MAKVFTGVEECRAISAVTTEESIPPDRNAPKGTSDISLILTASESSAFRRSLSSGSGVSVNFSAPTGRSQYFSVASAPFSKTSTEAGSSLRAALKMLMGLGIYCSVR